MGLSTPILVSKEEQTSSNFVGIGALLSSVAQALGGAIASKQQKEAAKAQEDLARQQVIAGVTSGRKNTIALVVIGGILVIGGLVAVISLKK